MTGLALLFRTITIYISAACPHQIGVPSNSHLFCHTFASVCTGPRSAVGNVSGYRCVSDCRSRGREFDSGPVPYFRGD